MIKTLTLKGQAAKKFGKTHQFYVADFPEMIRAMCSQVKGFKNYLSNAHHRGIHFAVFSGEENVGIEGFDLTKSATDYTLQPVPRGAKSGGLLQVVIGAAIIAASIYFPPAGIAMGMSAAASASVGTALAGVGISMAMGGVVQMLTPQPKMSVGASSSADNKPNYAFGSPVNTVAMGYPVPLLYGEREVGGAIISAGIFSSDQL